MKNNTQVIKLLCSVIISIKNTLQLPTHATLEKTSLYSLILLGCSITSTLFKFYTFISWQGCLICVIALFTLLWIERSENDALLRMYSTARVSTEKALQRAKAASAGVSGRRSTTVRSSSTKPPVKRKK